MKNFRKVLALVLVVATLFSFVAMASAKSWTEYKDNASISYDEAVAVLTSVGILNGTDKGTFEPTSNITRAEMAKMIAVLSNAGYDVSELYASACDFADSKDNWAASYIAYCAQTGIVAGRSATTFDPYGKVTGLETAKMLLVVLGFDAEKQGYVGANWKVNVLRDAKVMGLTDNFAAGYDIDAAITREEAAQMMLNALEAPAVAGYVSENIVYVTNSLIFDDKDTIKLGDYVVLNSKTTLKDALKLGKWALYGNVAISNDILYKTLFNLTVVDGYDCFGNPGVYWTGKTATGADAAIGYFFGDAPAATYTTAAALATDFKAEGNANYAMYLVVDGKKETIADGIDGLKACAAQTGKGVLTNVYVDHAAKTVLVTVVNTYIDTIDSANDRTGKITINGMTYTSDLNAGEIVLYKKCNGTNVKALTDLKGGKLHEVVKAEATPVTVEETWTVKDLAAAKSWIVASGEKYEYAKNLGVDMTVSNQYAESTGIVNALADNKALNLYLDEYGYIMYWNLKGSSVSYEYGYLVNDTTYGNNPHKAQGTDAIVYDYYGDMVNFDASLTEDMKIDEAMYKLDNDATGFGADYGYLVKYNKANGAWAATATLTASSIAADGRIGGTSVWCDDATKFLVRTYDYTAKSYVYTAYAGIDELPAGLLGYVYDQQGTLQYFTDGGNRATYVFLDAYYATAADYFVVLDTVAEGSISYLDKLVEAMTCYTALVDGEEAYVYSTVNNLKDYDLMRATVKTLTASYNGKPIYIATSHVAAAPLNEIETLSIKNGTMIINTIDNAWRYDNETEIILILKDGNGTASVSDDYIVLTGTEEIESFNGITGYDYGWYVVTSGTTADLNTMYIWVK